MNYHYYLTLLTRKTALLVSIVHKHMTVEINTENSPSSGTPKLLMLASCISVSLIMLMHLHCLIIISSNSKVKGQLAIQMLQ